MRQTFTLFLSVLLLFVLLIVWNHHVLMKQVTSGSLRGLGYTKYKRQRSSPISPNWVYVGGNISALNFDPSKPEKQLRFIHITKTGGTAVENAGRNGDLRIWGRLSGECLFLRHRVECCS